MEDRSGDIDSERSGAGFTDSLKWRIDVLDLKTGVRASEIFDAVLICSGHFFQPSVPAITGLQLFPGEVIHSHLYREPKVYKDKDLLIIGNGYSGRDIMVDTASHAKHVYFCNRGEFLTCPLPSNVEQLPALRELTAEGTACFVNGEERHVETIITATGYEYVFPYLTNNSGVSIEGAKRIQPLYKHTFNAVHTSMAFIGMNTGVMPFPYFDLQARWVMSVWKGEKCLPSKEEMVKDDEETYQERLRQGLPPRLAGHYLGVAQWDFYRELAQLGDGAYLNPEMELIYSEWEKLRCADVMNYKHTNIVRDGKQYKFVPADFSKH